MCCKAKGVLAQKPRAISSKPPRPILYSRSGFLTMRKRRILFSRVVHSFHLRFL
jgi:hypothetical protein